MVELKKGAANKTHWRNKVFLVGTKKWGKRRSFPNRSGKKIEKLGPLQITQAAGVSGGPEWVKKGGGWSPLTEQERFLIVDQKGKGDLKERTSHLLKKKKIAYTAATGSNSVWKSKRKHGLICHKDEIKKEERINLIGRENSKRELFGIQREGFTSCERFGIEEIIKGKEKMKRLSSKG